jgi:hypothetical protein
MFLAQPQNPGDKLKPIVKRAQMLSLEARFFHVIPRITQLSLDHPGNLQTRFPLVVLLAMSG